MEVRIEWSRQGRVHWEQHWLDEFGPIRSRIPDLSDHLGFVNFDLRQNGHCEVTPDGDGLLWLELPELEYAARQMVWDHFRIPGLCRTNYREPLPGLRAMLGCQSLLGNHGFTMVPSAYPGLRGGKEEVFSSVSRQEGAYIYSAAIGLIEAGMKDVRPPSFETNDGQLS